MLRNCQAVSQVIGGKKIKISNEKQAKQIKSNLEKLKYCRMMILFDGEEQDKMINSN